MSTIGAVIGYILYIAILIRITNYYDKKEGEKNG